MIVCTRSKEERAAEEARWQLPETTLPGPATKGDVLVLTKARCPAATSFLRANRVSTRLFHQHLSLCCSIQERKCMDDHRTHGPAIHSALSDFGLPSLPTMNPSQWLEGETARFNTVYAKREPAVPVIDFLRNAARRAGVIYDRAAAELARQVRAPRGSSKGRSGTQCGYLCCLKLWTELLPAGWCTGAHAHWLWLHRKGPHQRAFAPVIFRLTRLR